MLGDFTFFVNERYVDIYLMVPNKDTIAQLEVNPKGNKQVDICNPSLVDVYMVLFQLRISSQSISDASDLPAFSKINAGIILDYNQNNDAVNKIYKHIISYAKSFTLTDI